MSGESGLQEVVEIKDQNVKIVSVFLKFFNQILQLSKKKIKYNL